MDLRTYMDGLPRGGLAGLAAELGVSTVYLFQLAARQGGREPSPELCVRIERATATKVTRRDLRPSDWKAIWPELDVLPDTGHRRRATDARPLA